jgi:hypothetical protein
MKGQNVKDLNPREIAFNGIRLTLDSNKSFDDVVSSLLADIGDKPVLLSALQSTGVRHPDRNGGKRQKSGNHNARGICEP